MNRLASILRPVLLSGLLLTGVPCNGQAPAPAGEIPAFPGAEGFGAYTVGGRGGEVLLVTSLEDYGDDDDPIPGSLRAAVEEEGPRTVVFRVAGYIDLLRPLEIEHSHLTIAGHTAPGDGVTLRRYGVDVAAPQVIIRHLRIRPGDVAEVEQDALNIRAPDVIVDHCSVSWGTDETLSIIGEADDVTVQWCIISESLHNSVHSKGAHGYGTLLTATGDVSIHHTAYALHYSRNPRPKSLTLDFRNNLVYGFGGQAGYNYEDFTNMNYVGNFLHPLEHSRHPTCAFSLGGLNSRFFVEGNAFANLDETPTGGWDVICPDDVDPIEAARLVRQDQPIPAAYVTTHDAETARQLILEQAGALLPSRDAVDHRLAAKMESGEGEIIDSQSDVGGWPPLATADPPADTDMDGMPDRWESKHGLDPARGEDHALDADGDGYTNLEEFLNDTDPNVPFAWVGPPAFHPPSGTAFSDSILTVAILPPQEGVEVRYTLDGSDPTPDAPIYRAPLRITEDVHIRALSVVPGSVTMPSHAVYQELDWLVAQPAAVSRVNGLRYAYYEADDWDEVDGLATIQPLRQGVASGLDFSLRGDAPVHALAFDGYLNVPRDDVYHFYLIDDYRSELRIDGRLVTRGKPAGSDPGHVALRAGPHRFHVRILREAPVPPTQVLWASGDSGPEPVPNDLFTYDDETP